MSAVAVLGSSTAWVINSEAQGWTPVNHRCLVNTYGREPSRTRDEKPYTIGSIRSIPLRETTTRMRCHSPSAPPFALVLRSR